MGAKELQTTLHDTHSCTIHYETVWKGKEKSFAELYESWEDSFQLLFRWKEIVLEKMSDSIVEFDLDVQDGKVFFKRFFCALGPCLKGFRAGCRPYLSVEEMLDAHNRWQAN
jgi:hypothetical protein